MLHELNQNYIKQFQYTYVLQIIMDKRKYLWEENSTDRNVKRKVPVFPINPCDR